MVLIDNLKYKYKKWKEERFLKKHGCDNWKQYYRNTDPDRNIRADRVKDYYHGYDYVYCLDYREHHAYQLLYDYGPGGHRYGYEDIMDWCEANLAYKNRMDILRVFKQTPIGLNGAQESEWWINEIGGGDYVFFACQDPEDFFIFKMRWAWILN